MKRFFLILTFLMVLSCQISVFSQDDKNRRFPDMIEEQVTPEMVFSNNKLYMKNAPVGKSVEVYSIIGNKIKEIKITSSEFEQELNLRRGIYIFKVGISVWKSVIK